MTGSRNSPSRADPHVKVSFIYDDQDKDSHRFDTLEHGGHGDPLSYYRSHPHLRFASETAMG